MGSGITVTMDKVGTDDPNGVGAVRRIATPGPGPDIVEEVVTFEAPSVLGYKALSGTPFPGYAGEVRLTPAGAGTRINYTISTTASFPLVKAPLVAIARCCFAFSRGRPRRKTDSDLDAVPLVP